MNLVGKIFIVLVFVMSVLFMGFAVAIYASHKNWREVVEAPDTGLKAQLEKEKAESGRLTGERDRMQEQMASAEDTRAKVLADLQTELQTLRTKSDNAEKALTQQTQDVRAATATLAEAHKTLATLRGDVDKLRAEIRQEQQEKDAAFSVMVALTDEQHDLTNELSVLKTRNQELAEDHADALQVLRDNDLKPIPELYAKDAAKVDGLVLAVRNTGLIEVSIGKDDGLLAGHTLEVYRLSDSLNTYLGKVEVTQVEPDKAACKILPNFQKGTIEKGDRVASKLK